MSGEPGELEISILRSIRAGLSIQDIAKHSGLPSASLGKTIATLQIGGLLNDDGSISERGIEVLERSPKTQG